MVCMQPSKSRLVRDAANDGSLIVQPCQPLFTNSPISTNSSHYPGQKDYPYPANRRYGTLQNERELLEAQQVRRSVRCVERTTGLSILSL